MSSSLLRPSTDVENNYIFGKFRGFTMKPLPGANKIAANTPKVAYVHPVTKANNDVDLHIVPTREAPPPPVPKHAGGVNAAVEKFNNINATAAPPALPPLNKGSTARPIISHPILEASTCDAKEVPSLVKYPTIRAAPAPPKADQKPTSAFDDNVVPEVLINPIVEKKPKDGTLKRFQSFLKKDPSIKQEKVHKQLKGFDKDQLKDLQISSPIIIAQVPLKDASNDDKKTKINRAQSMRDPPSPPVQKPLNTFGSMRQPRPKSIVDRPTLPPPPRPPAPVTKGPPIAQPEKSPNEYDDCEPGTPDNIYSVIEETQKSPPGSLRQQGSIESMGLLSEIVNEIEHRNFDSIYIASTLKKKKKPGEAGYANAKPVEEEYAGDAGSTTSSGYMRPIGAPIARIPPSQSINKMPSTASSNSMSSFKSAKSGSTDSTKNVTSPDAKVIKFDGPMKKSNSDLGKKESEGGYKTPTSNKPLADEKNTIGPRRPSLKKTVTPPSITLPKKTVVNARKRSPSPTKPAASLTRVPSKPKTLTKPTPVKAPVVTSKPSLKTSSSLTNGSAKVGETTVSKVLSAAANKKSNVAALQQKFESSNS